MHSLDTEKGYRDYYLAQVLASCYARGVAGDPALAEFGHGRSQN